MNAIVVKVNDKTSTVAEYATEVENSSPKVIKAQSKVNYELVNQKTGRAPDHIVTKRVGKDLLISFEEGDESSSFLIEGFYDSADSALIGLAEDGSYYYYVPETAEIADYVTELRPGDIESQVLGGQAQTTPWWVGAIDEFNAVPWL